MPDAWLVSRDLMCSSRVTSAAEASGHRVQVVSSLPQLRAAWSREAARPVLLDLTTTGRLTPADLDFLTAPESPEATEPASAAEGDGVPILAFGPHVQEGLLEAARDAGCTHVFTRGQLHQRLSAGWPFW